jgi:predicted enzyme related to lactoylglutathione lyase
MEGLSKLSHSRLGDSGTPKMTKLFRIVMPVSNLADAVLFYAAILDVPNKQVSAGRQYFDCGGTILCVYNPMLDGDEEDPGRMPTPVYISVSDLEAVHERAKAAGARNLGSIETRPWGERSFYMTDPFKNPICVVDEDTIFQGQFFVGE